MPKSESSFWSQGDVITGLSGKAEYKVERKLGEGANGQVFLVTRYGGRFAMKIGNAGPRFQSEIATLKKLSPRTEQDRPLFIGSDVLIADGIKRPYYLMSYIQGCSLASYLEQKGLNQLYVIGYKLLRKLWLNHRQGFAFGDLKPSNIVVSGSGDIDLIDYGGATRFGGHIRQFTEVYDREYWNCGSRRADFSYDLFSFAMLFMQMSGAAYPGRGDVPILPQHRNAAELLQAVRDNEVSRPAESVLKKMILGEYQDMRKALEDWRGLLAAQGMAPNPKPSLGFHGWFGGIIGISVVMLIGFVWMACIN